MTPELAAYIEAGRALNEGEREIAGLVLLQGDDVDEAAIEAEWSETVNRRLDELLSGKVKSVSGRETIAMLRARSAALRDGTRMA